MGLWHRVGWGPRPGGSSETYAGGRPHSAERLSVVERERQLYLQLAGHETAAAIEGWKVSEYKKFAEDAKPFVEGSSGYFKMNLYPIAFRNTNRELWASAFSSITGFSSKDEYVLWCKDKRLPTISGWVQASVPELLLCLGKDVLSRFCYCLLRPCAQLDYRDHRLIGTLAGPSTSTGRCMRRSTLHGQPQRPRAEHQYSESRRTYRTAARIRQIRMCGEARVGMYRRLESGANKALKPTRQSRAA